MHLIVRPAAAADAVVACEVLRRSIREICVADHGNDPAILEAWLRNKTPEIVRAWFESSRGYSVVAEVDGKIAGVARLAPNNTVVLCYVVPEVLHQGVGKAMLMGLEQEARARTIRSLELGSTKTAHDFYTRHGYRDTGNDEAMFGLVAIGMRKDLAEP